MTDARGITGARQRGGTTDHDHFETRIARVKYTKCVSNDFDLVRVMYRHPGTVAGSQTTLPEGLAAN